MKTQKQKILELLQRSGASGVTNYDLNSIAFRYAARIKDLRDDGHDIVTVKGKKKSEWRFILRAKLEQQRMFV